MHSLPPLISDLALILIIAGIVTLIFKRLRQPLVLGYIVAGFLAGQHMPYMPTVQDAHSIETWSNIGVIFLMFTLGLEFSLKKIINMGARPILSATLVMASMLGVGSVVGRLFGWSSMDCLFLGGMLAMSSTTIIYKAYDDLGLRQKRFASEVLSVLILEDILGILLMVLLSALAVSKHFDGLALAGSLLSLGFFLVLWFVVGIYVVPRFLRQNRKLMSGETLLIVSIGLCFLLVVLADRAGYSAAFGAFMMGSILAETVEAEDIEHVVNPVKDLFGAIFFVSVGMLVDPKVLIDYWPAILAITAAILLGQAVLGTSAFVVSGHPLHRAMNCGFSLAQIGEFAFIIAAMGVTLGVTSAFLYPIVVAVSIVTTFLTPYMIKAADPAHAWVERHLPEQWLEFVATQRQAAETRRAHFIAQSPERYYAIMEQRVLWTTHLKAILLQTVIFGVLIIATIGLSFSALLPALRTLLTHWPGNALTALVTLTVVGLFARPLVMRKNHSLVAKQLLQTPRHRRLLQLLWAVRFVLAAYPLYYILEFLSPTPWWLHALGGALLLVGIIRSRVFKYYSIRLERNFMLNLRQREAVAQQQQAGKGYAGRLRARDVHFARLVVPSLSQWAGQSLQTLDFAASAGVLVAAVIRGAQRTNAPAGDFVLFPNDILEVIADDKNLEDFTQRMQLEVITPQPLDGHDHTLRLRRWVVRPSSPLVGCTLANSGIRSDYGCMLVGCEEEGGTITIATADYVITRGSVLWVVGEPDDLERLGERFDPTPIPSKSTV